MFFVAMKLIKNSMALLSRSEASCVLLLIGFLLFHLKYTTTKNLMNTREMI